MTTAIRNRRHPQPPPQQQQQAEAKASVQPRPRAATQGFPSFKVARVAPHPVPAPPLPATLWKVLSDGLVSLSLSVLAEADDDAPDFVFETSDAGDEFRCPNSKKELAYLRLRLGIISLFRCWEYLVSLAESTVYATLLLAALVNTAVLVVTVLRDRFIRLFQSAQSVLIHNQLKPRADSAISLSPLPQAPTPSVSTPTHSLPNPTLSILLLSSNNADTISQLCSRLISTCKALSLTSRIDYVLVDAASLDDTVIIAQRVFESNKQTLTVFRDSRGTKWESKLMQGIRNSSSDFALVINADIGRYDEDVLGKVAKWVSQSLIVASGKNSCSNHVSFFPSLGSEDSLSFVNKAAKAVKFPLQPDHLNILFGRTLDFIKIAQVTDLNRQDIKQTDKSSVKDGWWTVARSVEDAGCCWVPYT
ncbi:hypothetical protein BCR33DRAFT_306600 [Rhizoclosmatium globosum]|uniref:Glycosyltransferase 2-like domain-containing protein n=1 Tax=Rhizoclosmatium globosum TaxID=329046 RepID=A0A1Y2C5V4_9FUNG|nr:hypothetical protein BCR33DRAFT_306600 [Rhizoclosmatium globosum]|eukprot:ORY42257.1 hypothetical protein BCR33DRAFT_306600 [Rhizoclosmatium globosum]